MTLPAHWEDGEYLHPPDAPKSIREIGSLWAQALRAGRAVRHDVFINHRYRCNQTVETCSLIQQWKGMAPPHLVDYEISDNHW